MPATLPALLTALADAFAVEERKDARVTSVDVSKQAFRLLSNGGADAPDFDRIDAMTALMWNARLVLNPNLADDEIILHYRRPDPKRNREKAFFKRVTLGDGRPPAQQPAEAPTKPGKRLPDPPRGS